MRFLVLVFLIALAPLGNAAVIKATNGVELLAIDGQKMKGGMFKKNKVTVADGSHQIVVRFAKQIKNESMVYSRAHIFPLEITGDTVISIRHFTSKSQAEHAVRTGLTWLVKSGGKTQKIANSDVIFNKGVQINPDIEKLVLDYNIANGTVSAPINTENAQVIKNASSKTALLIETYRSASLDERKAFRLWLVEQELK